MKFQWKPPRAEQVWKLLDKYKFVLLLLAAGLALLLWPAGEREETVPAGTGEGLGDFDLEALRAYRESEMMGNTFRKVKAYRELLSAHVAYPFLRDGQ